MNASDSDAKRVDWQGVAAFLLVVVALTWPAEIMAYLQGVRFNTESFQAAGYLLLAVSVMPAFTAWIVRTTATKEGFATSGLRFGPWQYYVLTWIAVPWIYIVIYGLTVAAGFGRIAVPAGVSGQLLILTLALSLSINIIPALIPAFGSQLGWTGFVLPKLLPLGIWQATIGTGLLWGLWQLPLAAMGYIYSGRPVGFVLVVLFTCALAMVEGALRVRTNSLLLPIFFEATFSTVARGIAPLLVIITAPLLGSAVGLIGIAVVAAVGAWLIATTPQAAVDLILTQQREAPVKVRAKMLAKRNERSRSS